MPGSVVHIRPVAVTRALGIVSVKHVLIDFWPSCVVTLQAYSWVTAW